MILASWCVHRGVVIFLIVIWDAFGPSSCLGASPENSRLRASVAINTGPPGEYTRDSFLPRKPNLFLGSTGRFSLLFLIAVWAAGLNPQLSP